MLTTSFDTPYYSDFNVIQTKVFEGITINEDTTLGDITRVRVEVSNLM